MNKHVQLNEKNMRVIHTWTIALDDLDIPATIFEFSGNNDAIFDWIRTNASQSIISIADELDLDAHDALEKFGPGEFWLYDVGAAFRVTHFADSVTVELIQPFFTGG